MVRHLLRHCLLHLYLNTIKNNYDTLKMENINTIEELTFYIQDICGSLSISHDYPNEENILGWFKKYDEIRNKKIDDFIKNITG